ncbi:MAG: penicillin-binding protein activator [Hyphomicrobiaceae bacterium]
MGLIASFLQRPFVTACAGLFLTGCAAGSSGLGGSGASLNNVPANTQQTPLVKRQSVKVALLLPLTKVGKGGQIAKSLKQSGELALFEFDRPDVVLFTKDTKGTPEGAREAAMAAIRDGAELVIGPLFADSVRAASVITRSANVPMVAFSSDRSVAGKGVYLMSFLAGEDVPRIVNFAAGQGSRRFAALVPKSPYGQLVERAFRDSVARTGGQVLTVERYPLDANGMLKPVERLKKVEKRAAQSGQPLDALLLPAGQEAIPTLSPLMPYFNIDTTKVKLIGTGDWDYPNIGAEKPLLNGWYPAPDPKGWRAFTQRYVKTYGSPPPRIASIGYDAVSLAVSLSRNPAGQRFTPGNLTRASGFAGVDGLFRLRSDGTVERGLAILEVQRFGSRVIDPAPGAFGGSQYSASVRKPITGTLN